jgi:hypothetical protein
MLQLYYPGTHQEAEAQPPKKLSAETSRRCPPQSFLNTIDEKRYAFLAEQFRKLDSPVYAEMCERFAAEHRETAVKLNALDAKLYPLTGGAAE